MSDTAELLRIEGSPGKPMVTLRPDGTIEYGDDYTPDAAARLFWSAIREQHLTDRRASATEMKAAICEYVASHLRGLGMEDAAAAVEGFKIPGL